ncbi:hypothetical protein [Kitasatospora sp. P5_F3]
MEKLDADEEGRPGWGLRDQETGELVLAGGETDRYGTPETARMHIQSHWYHTIRGEDIARHLAAAAHIDQFETDAARRRNGGLGVPARELLQPPSGRAWYAVARPEATDG